MKRFSSFGIGQWSSGFVLFWSVAEGAFCETVLKAFTKFAFWLKSWIQIFDCSLTSSCKAQTRTLKSLSTKRESLHFKVHSDISSKRHLLIDATRIRWCSEDGASSKSGVLSTVALHWFRLLIRRWSKNFVVQKYQSNTYQYA